MRFNGVVFVLYIFLGVSFVESIVFCRNRLESFYPKCNCKEENYGYDAKQHKCVIMCPSISEGEYPNCACRFGDAYDNSTNSCPNPICPPNTTADSVYPNCTCTARNSEYSDYLNVCIQSCPEDSSGRYPNCKCDDPLQGFSKDWGCKQCPPGSKPEFLYPNCQSIKPNATYAGDYQNIYEECPPNTYGIVDDCHCKNGNTFKQYTFQDPYEHVDRLDGYDKDEKNLYDNDIEYSKPITNRKWTSDLHCSHCPNPIEVFPNCTCAEGRVFDGLYCRRCPPNAEGLYGDCECEGQVTYVKETNKCVACPNNSTGKHPNCMCEEPKTYDTVKMECVDCPEGTTGKFPNCHCQNESAVFIPPWRSCRQCPENSTGRFPNCTCTEEDHIYSAYINKCYIGCGDAIGIHPNCDCDIHYTFDVYYDAEERICKSLAYAGRQCPPGSVGIAPDCLCYVGFFETSGWGCFVEYSKGPTNYPCDRWPQCDLGIDTTVLKSLVG